MAVMTFTGSNLVMAYTRKQTGYYSPSRSFVLPSSFHSDYGNGFTAAGGEAGDIPTQHNAPFVGILSRSNCRVLFILMVLYLCSNRQQISTSKRNSGPYAIPALNYSLGLLEHIE
jgi:hypothetical protein